MELGSLVIPCRLGHNTPDWGTGLVCGGGVSAYGYWRGREQRGTQLNPNQPFKL